MTVTLAPAVMVRVAAWPSDTLAVLGDAELGARARAIARQEKPGRRDRAAHHAHRAELAAVEARYHAAYAADRRALRARTADDPRFVHALWLANPTVAAKLDELRPLEGDTPPAKRERHLETTLYRHLARAAGRATPCDAWSGVTMARFGPATRIEASPARIVLAPDLRPFQAMLRQLGTRPDYRARARYALNPTLARAEDGRWVWWRRSPWGPCDRGVMDPHPIADRLIAAARSGPLRGEALIAALDGPPEWTPHAPAILGALADARVLLGGLDLPVRFGSPWQALDRAGRPLGGAHRGAWNRARNGLASLAERLASPPAGVSRSMAALHAEGRAILEALARALDVEVQLPRAVMRADLVAPHAITLGPELAERLRAIVEGYDALQDELGLGLAFRADARAREAERFARGVSIDALEASDAALPVSAEGATWESIARETHAGPALMARLEAWRALLDAPGRAVTWTPAGRAPMRPAPLGCLVLAPYASRAWIHGVIDEPTVPYARFAWVLGAADPLRAWFARRWRDLAAATGLELRELATFAEAHPNVAARPLLARRTFEPWTARAAPLAVATENGRYVARVAGRAVAIASFVSAPTIGDPIARVALTTTFRDAPSHAIQASTVPLDAELSRSTPSPAVELADGTLVRSRRLVLHGAALSALVEKSGFERFLAWQALASEHDFPAEIQVRRDTEPPITLVRDSPLSLDAVLEGAREGVSRLMIEHPPEERPWLVAADGRAYVSELAVPFERAEHAWS